MVLICLRGSCEPLNYADENSFGLIRIQIKIIYFCVFTIFIVAFIGMKQQQVVGDRSRKASDEPKSDIQYSKKKKKKWLTIIRKPYIC